MGESGTREGVCRATSAQRRADGPFGPLVTGLLDWTDRNRLIVLAAIGYGICRCTSVLSGKPEPSLGMSFWADAGKIAGIALFVVAAYLRDPDHRSSPVFFVPSLVAMAGAVVGGACPVLGPPLAGACERVTVFAVGCGTAAAMLQWLELIACVSLRRIVVIVASAETICSVVSLLVGKGTAPTYVALGLSVTVSLALLMVCRHGWEASPYVSLEPASRRPVPVSQLVSWRLLVWVGVYCFAYGFVSSHCGASITASANHAGNLLPCLVTLVAAAVAPDHFGMRTLKSAAFVFMASGLVVVAATGIDRAWVMALLSAGAASCRLFAYSLACMRARRNGVSSIASCALVKALVILATLGGMTTGSCVAPAAGNVAVVVLAVAAVLMSAFLSPFGINEELLIEQAREERKRDSADARLGAYATERGLSPREATVFLCMAKGLGTAEIGDELFITKSAVRAHQSRIYAKLGVHSQQEFMRVVDEIGPRG